MALVILALPLPVICSPCRCRCPRTTSWRVSAPMSDASSHRADHPLQTELLVMGRNETCADLVDAATITFSPGVQNMSERATRLGVLALSLAGFALPMMAHAQSGTSPGTSTTNPAISCDDVATDPNCDPNRNQQGPGAGAAGSDTSGPGTAGENVPTGITGGGAGAQGGAAGEGSAGGDDDAGTDSGAGAAGSNGGGDDSGAGGAGSNGGGDGSGAGGAGSNGGGDGSGAGGAGSGAGGGTDGGGGGEGGSD